MSSCPGEWLSGSRRAYVAAFVSSCCLLAQAATVSAANGASADTHFSASPIVIRSLDDALRITVPLVVRVKSRNWGREAWPGGVATWYVCEIVNDIGNSGFVPSEAMSPTSIHSLPGLPPLSVMTSTCVIGERLARATPSRRLRCR
jgi:hypothetical protein